MRTDGYRQAMEDNGISPQKAYEFSSPSEDSGTLFRLSEEMIKNSGVPDAIFCVNWFRTIGVYGAAKKLGIRLLNGIPLRTKPPPRNSNAPGRKPFRARNPYGFRALNGFRPGALLLRGGGFVRNGIPFNKRIPSFFAAP